MLFKTPFIESKPDRVLPFWMLEGCPIIDHYRYGRMIPAQSIILKYHAPYDESPFFRLNFHVTLIMLTLIRAIFTKIYESFFIFSHSIGKKMEWLEDKKRQVQIDTGSKSADESYFGYERVDAAAKTDRVIQHFNSVARHYDFMNTLLSFGIHYAWKRTAVRMLNLSPGNHILDVCGGTGDLAILAARAVGPDGRVVIYDINRAMIRSGMHKVISTDIEDRLGYIQGNAEFISFPDRHFDSAMVGFGIRNVTHMKKGFEEMCRVLKPGGKLMCLEFSKPTWPVFRWLYDVYSFYIMPFLGQLIAGNRKAYTHLPESIRMFPLPDELAELLKKIGFSRVTYRSLTNGIAVIHLAVK